MTLNLQRINNIDQINGNPEAKPSEKKSLAQVKAEFVKGVMDKMHGDDFDSEEERQAFENKIQQKIESEAYQKLLETEEDLKKAKKSDTPMEDPFKADEEEDDDSTVSYSFGSGGYQEAVSSKTIFQAGA